MKFFRESGLQRPQTMEVSAMEPEAHHYLEIDGHSLSIKDVVDVARGLDGEFPLVRLSSSCRESLIRQRKALEVLIRAGRVMYGVDTGCGSNRRRVISEAELDAYQYQYICTHAVGVGEPLPVEQVRAMMLIRANSLSGGNSAVTVELIERILVMLNLDIIPVIPTFGSVGASGDLIPLAHLGAAMIGLSAAFVYYQGKKVPASEALKACNLEPLVLHAKEAMGLTNGATLILASAILSYYDSEQILSIANVVAALSLEAIRGEKNAFDPRIHAARHQEGQIFVAAEMRELFEGSKLMTEEAQSVPFDASGVAEGTRVQDAYSSRCVPQAHGAVLDAISYLEMILFRELNSSTDNPLLFESESGFDVLSGGNFHGDPLSIPLEAVGIGLAKLAQISNSRQLRLLSTKFNHGLSQDLSGRGASSDTGFMITQYMVASRVNSLVWMANPAATINLPTSELQEDYVSMASNSAWKLREMLKHLEYVLANELLLACQGISIALRKLPEPLAHLGLGTGKVYDLVRIRIPIVEGDRELKPLVDEALELVQSRAILEILK